MHVVELEHEAQYVIVGSVLHCEHVVEAER